MRKSLKSSFHREVTKAEIEFAITSAVQQSDPSCAAFSGAIIELCPYRPTGANWVLKGVRYGRAPRATCDEVLLRIVEKLEAQFVVRH